VPWSLLGRSATPAHCRQSRVAPGPEIARDRKAKAAQFVSSSFLDWICCCCCITGLPSLGCINCSSLKLRRMESNSTAEPFAMVCSRCAIVRRESRVYGSEVARAKAKQSAARLLNSSDWSDMAAPRRVGGGGMASNHHLVLFTHALCQLSYPAVMKRIKPTYCESVSLSETASVVTVGAGDGGPAWFASSWANRLNTDGIIETMLSGLSGTNIGVTAEIRRAWRDAPSPNVPQTLEPGRWFQGLSKPAEGGRRGHQ
jgi:hypothetical protein